MVGLAFALDAIATELLLAYLAPLTPDQRKGACDRMMATVADNGKSLVDLAPKQPREAQARANALIIRDAANTIIAQMLKEAMVSIAPAAAPVADAPK